MIIQVDGTLTIESRLSNTKYMYSFVFGVFQISPNIWLSKKKLSYGSRKCMTFKIEGQVASRTFLTSSLKKTRGTKKLKTY
jgi:hypothetical protein